jgi:type I restriction enzyme S subunit
MSEIKQGYKQTEVGVIPDDWEVKYLSEISEVRSGKRLPLGYYVAVNRTSHPYIRVIDMYVGGVDVSNIMFVPEEAFPAISNYRIYKNDIFISVAGTLGIVGKIPIELDGANLTENANKITQITCIQEYLMYYLISSYIQNIIISEQTVGAQPKLALNRIRSFPIILPNTKEEQIAIATALSDIDSLISALNKKIEKKKNMKQGAMQQLLTGKKRLEGFSGEWVEMKLGEVANDIKTGKRNGEEQVTDGQYPLFVRSKLIQRINTYSFDGEAILIPGEGGIGTIIHYINGKFDYHQRVYKISNFDETNGKFIYYNMMIFFNDHASKNSVKATVDSLRLPTFLEYALFVPPTKEEQTDIAQILTDMDNEISALETKRDKYVRIKSGMMQELLTGKIRLVDTSETKQAIETHKTIGHNQYFEDAVLIAAIVNAFYSDKYALGRKKVQKLLYLLRRKQEANMAAFKRKAAGPYANEVRYKGGEPIANNSNYIIAKTSKFGTLFSKGKKINKALEYIEKWNMQPDIDWLVSQFKFSNVDQLEVLATIDMAICDLEKENKTVSLLAIKNLIVSDKQWKAKLDKPYFNDLNIQKAINESYKLFGE